MILTTPAENLNGIRKCEPIYGFDGQYRFLSNFSKDRAQYDGVWYPTSENAYQAAKCADPFDRQQFLNITPGQAKRLGQEVTLRKDWEELKIGIMHQILTSKFSEESVGDLLLNTGDAELHELNTWDDRFWGIIEVGGMYYGLDHLGKVLMQVRLELYRTRILGVNRFGW